MIELLSVIYAKLLVVHPRVFLERAPDKTQFPYVTYNLPTSDEQENREDFILEVDIWDNKTDTTVLETLTSTIDGNGAITGATGLNRLHHYENGVLQADFYRINRLQLPDPDEKIRRRQLRYEVKAYL